MYFITINVTNRWYQFLDQIRGSCLTVQLGPLHFVTSLDICLIKMLKLMAYVIVGKVVWRVLPDGLR
jgi:hypothetical protein